MSEYAHARAALDPLGTIYLDDGSRLLRIALALSDDPDCDPPTTSWTRSASWTAPAPARSRTHSLSSPITPTARAGADDRQDPDRATVARELERLLHRLRLPYVRRAAPDVIATATSAALGARRSPPRAARRGGRRPRPSDDPDPPPRVRAAGRQDVRRLGTRAIRDPRPDPAGAADAGMDRPRTRSSRLRPVRDRQDRTSSKRSGTRRSTRAAPSRGTPPRRSRNCCAATASMTASTRRSGS